MTHLGSNVGLETWFPQNKHMENNKESDMAQVVSSQNFKENEIIIEDLTITFLKNVLVQEEADLRIKKLYHFYKKPGNYRPISLMCFLLSFHSVDTFHFPVSHSEHISRWTCTSAQVLIQKAILSIYHILLLQIHILMLLTYSRVCLHKTQISTNTLLKWLLVIGKANPTQQIYRVFQDHLALATISTFPIVNKTIAWIGWEILL